MVSAAAKGHGVSSLKLTITGRRLMDDSLASLTAAVQNSFSKGLFIYNSGWVFTRLFLFTGFIAINADCYREQHEGIVNLLVKKCLLFNSRILNSVIHYFLTIKIN